MIVCSRCGKENQDHYKFCLGCGNEIAAAKPQAPARAVEASPPRQAPSPVEKPPHKALAPTPPAGLPSVEDSDDSPSPLLAQAHAGGLWREPAVPQESDGLGQTVIDPRPAGAAEPQPGTVICSACQTENPVDFTFCGNCGAKLKKPEKKKAWGRLALIKPDGTMGGDFALVDDVVMIGREAGDLFAHDGYLSPVHARISWNGEVVALEDAGSLNGVFIKITGEEHLEDGDIFRIGQELLRFDAIRDPQVLEDGTEVMGSPNPDYWGRLSLIAGPGLDGSAFPLMGEEVMLGRERGDILFPDDGYVSGLHAKIGLSQSGYTLADLDSSNGTFLRLTAPRLIPSGTFILMGQQLFLLEAG